MDVVTLGETMVLFVPTETGPLKYIYQFNKHIGGAESNVAIGLSKLGVKAGWISKLGKDGFGDYIESFIRGEGVDVSQVKEDEEHPTGVFFLKRGLKLEKVGYTIIGKALLLVLWMRTT